ncbi:putative MerR family transcriptional regulator [Magnetofaba australis IT-1]|uniref:Putative MerR family transcriptional regulator n=2 Tax=Magnetofaba TaxID=1472292 RepID=A0A1Y2K602_9PROT|nr:putative MerR family transcriptional regulator [Magnetofaba australis IT-1]
MVKIGVVAKRLDISIRTIHMYEREGLFIAYKNSAGTRYFTERDVEWLIEVRKMIKAGISIAGIRRLMSLIPCWESKACTFEGKHNCPVIHDNKTPCWANKNNMCTQNTQECRECEVYGMRFCVSMLKNFVDIRFKNPDQLSMQPRMRPDSHAGAAAGA